MNQNGTQGADREGRLSEVLAEWLEAAERGAPPEEADYLRRYPEFAAELAECFAAWKRFPRPGAPAARSLAGPELSLPESSQLGDFRILREVGRGGMGIVYEAEQISLGRRVALKVLPFAGAMDPRQLQRFRMEAQAAAQLHHTNIVPVHFVGSERGVHFYAMQFIDGRTLADYIAEQRGRALSPVRPLAEAEAAAASATTAPLAAQATSAAPRDAAYFRRVAEWGIQAAEALDCAHSLGVVHRDVKPANLLVDAAGRLWVTDFGLAQVQSDARLTMTGDLVGTLRYMSPEQALARRVVIDHRTDVYSLGATLYELVTLQPAFAGNDRQELLGQIALEEPAPPRRLNRRIPVELETIVLKAMEKNPSDRYVTALELAEDLRRFLGDQPIRAKRPSWLQRLRKLVRRHRAVVTVAAATLAVALVVSSVLIWRERADTLSALCEANVQRARALERTVLTRRYLYAADMKLAHQALQNPDLRMLRELLARHIPGPGEEDLRGFEWHYLCGMEHTASQTLRRHTAEVNHVTYSRDGKWLATASQDRTVQLWDAATGQPVRAFTGHTRDVNWVSFSPDGATLASAADDGTLRLWDAATGRERAMWKGHASEAVAAEFSPDGLTVASCGQDKQVKLWDAATGRLVATLEGHTDRVEALTFTPDGKTLISAGHEGVAMVWDVSPGHRGQHVPPRRLAAFPARMKLFGVVVTPDGQTLALAGEGCVKLLDVSSGRQKAELIEQGRVDAVAFSADGRTLAAGCEHGNVRLHDLATGEVRTALGHKARVWSVAFSPDGQKLASAGADGIVQLWEPRKLYPRRLVQRYSSYIHGVAFSPDGRALATSSEDGSARLLDVHTGRLRLELNLENAPQVGAAAASSRTGAVACACLAFTPDGKTLLVSSPLGKVGSWDLQSGRLAAELPARPGHFVHLALSPDGKMLATSGGDWLIQLWDRAAKTPALRLEQSGRGADGPDQLHALTFSPTGETLAVARRHSLMLWDVPTGRLRLNAHDEGSTCLAFSPDGRTLVTGMEGLRIRDALTGELRGTLLGHKPGAEIHAVAFSPDGKTLATSATDKTIRLWNMATWQELFVLAQFPPEGPGPLAFSPDGTTLAAAAFSGGESRVYLWLAGAGTSGTQFVEHR
jgi:WD40 repeat protein/serine/threonine protein kinase